MLENLSRHTPVLATRSTSQEVFRRVKEGGPPLSIAPLVEDVVCRMPCMEGGAQHDPDEFWIGCDKSQCCIACAPMVAVPAHG